MNILNKIFCSKCIDFFFEFDKARTFCCLFVNLNLNFKGGRGHDFFLIFKRKNFLQKKMIYIVDCGS